MIHLYRALFSSGVKNEQIMIILSAFVNKVFEGIMDDMEFEFKMDSGRMVMIEVEGSFLVTASMEALSNKGNVQEKSFAKQLK